MKKQSSNRLLARNQHFVGDQGESQGEKRSVLGVHEHHSQGFDAEIEQKAQFRNKSKTIRLFNIGLWANVIEWYEFLIYIHLSSIISQCFFKTASAVESLIQTFTLLAISYFARPFGSLFFGYLAEKRGRKNSLQLSLMMMSIPTIAIGLLPTYESIGYTSTLCLLTLRLIQGFAAGGELPGVGCYMFENSPLHHRSLLLGITSNSSIIGSALGSLVASLLFLCCDESTILNGAWRLPFLLGIPLTLWIYSIRKQIEDHPKMNIQGNTAPFKTLWQKEKFILLKAFVLSNYSTSIGVYLIVWIPFYLTHFLHYSPALAHPLNTVMLWVSVPLSIGAAWIARYVGAINVMRINILLSLILIYPLFKLMQVNSLPILIFSIFILNTLFGFIGGVIFEVLGSLFTHSRALGMSLSMTLPAATLGGLTPVLLTTTIHKTGWILFPAFYCLALGLLALPAALTLNRNVV